MNTFARMKGFIRPVLDDAGFQDAKIFLGPDLRDYPNDYVLLTPYGGPGMELDGVMDARSWQVRSVGKQMDHDESSSAENMANAIDIAFLSFYSQRVGGVWVSDVRRVGGAPSAMQATDDANRAHFVGSYTASVELALSN